MREACGEVRDPLPNVRERARGARLVPPEGAELRVLRVEQRFGFLTQRDDLQSPLALFARAVRLGIVERLAQAEGFREPSARLAHGVRERLCAIRAELGDRVPDFGVRVANPVVEAHEQGARAHGEAAQLGVRDGGARRVAATPEQHDEAGDAEHDDEHDDRADRPQGAREHVHAPSVGGTDDRELAADVPRSAASRS